jgi:type IV secretory pathway VirB10-like protein
LLFIIWACPSFHVLHHHIAKSALIDDDPSYCGILLSKLVGDCVMWHSQNLFALINVKTCIVNVGVQTAVAEFSTRKVTVTGTMDANKLVDYVYKKTKKQAKIVPKPEPEPEKKEEENKEGEKPADEEEAKPEENEGEKAAAEEEAKPEENKKEERPTEEPKKEEEGENKEEMGGEESKEETKKEESGAVVYIDEEGMKRMMYSYEYHPLYVIEPARGPQLFSDENPNACSIS